MAKKYPPFITWKPLLLILIAFSIYGMFTGFYNGDRYELMFNCMALLFWSSKL